MFVLLVVYTSISLQCGEVASSTSCIADDHPAAQGILQPVGSNADAGNNQQTQPVVRTLAPHQPPPPSTPSSPPRASPASPPALRPGRQQ